MSTVFALLSDISELTDYLYLSGFGPVRDDNLKRLGINCVVDATNLMSNKPLPGMDYVKVCVDDNENADIERHFDRVADKIQEHRARSGKTLVHCAAGISRSATLCIVYLIKHERMTLRDAYKFVYQKRPVISPNLGFWRKMIDYEKQQLGQSSVNMIRTKYRELPDVYLDRSRTEEGL